MKKKSSPSAVIYTPARWTGNNISFKGGLCIVNMNPPLHGVSSAPADTTWAGHVGHKAGEVPRDRGLISITTWSELIGQVGKPADYRRDPTRLQLHTPHHLHTA